MDGEEPGEEAQDQGRPADELDEDESHGGHGGGRYPEALRRARNASEALAE